MRHVKHITKKNGEIHWQLDIRNEYVDVNEMIKRAEKLFFMYRRI